MNCVKRLNVEKQMLLVRDAPRIGQ